MSYLEMASAPLPNMNKGIISFWFRDPSKGTAPSDKDWPSGQWLETTADSTMVPPNVVNLTSTLDDVASWWNSYGMPIQNFPGILGPTPLYMPVPPAFITNRGMHMLLTFGNPNQSYDYYPWRLEYPSVIDFVYYANSLFPFPAFQPESFPAPYAPYYVNLGNHGGKFRNINMTLVASPVNHPGFVPQSFIGINKDGHLIICLQTNTKATYTGHAYMMETVTNLLASATRLIIDGPPHTYNQVGFPYPDGHWVEYPGYWNGYEFRYKDISQEIMGCQMESFIIGGTGPGILGVLSGAPVIRDGSWHHVLFSFDISGSVSVDQPVVFDIGTNPPTGHTGCRAWLAVDDKNYTGDALQPGVPDTPGVLTGGALPGMDTGVLGNFGISTSYSRDSFGNLGPNDILPRQAYIHPVTGNPRDGLIRHASASGIAEHDTKWFPAGVYNPLSWAGSLWPLYGDGVAPGPWLPTMTPAAPSTPDPKTFDTPHYQCSKFSIPVNGHPIGIPASAHHLAHNTGVEMAELQIWANQTLDTGDPNMRRLFIDKDGKPTSTETAEKVLGTPDIRLHGTNNWKKGKNTGTSGIDPDGNTISRGQFEPVAKIEKFLPDPQLGK